MPQDVLVLGYNRKKIDEEIEKGNYVIVLASHVRKSKANETFITKNIKDALEDLTRRVDKIIV